MPEDDGFLRGVAYQLVYDLAAWNGIYDYYGAEITERSDRSDFRPTLRERIDKMRSGSEEGQLLIEEAELKIRDLDFTPACPTCHRKMPEPS